ncbi:hypothetical protein DICPUDRAFT_156963 [Dictyostelium purpureum]|uniref:Actin binding protein n=1 Tax=Dictyostelium purpureum TaxID=5786 RepID=F0ZXW8_DICPU|nr:uncharacterized protein DICPUDRAFT_156963 [Dictyostelium purpureum]EGC31207.1 hypothetical protein DICPUDRAFT_156963 [Dictyostelium purpureum]|eukprot:XP_003292267.1 hypothetical protein DICPUDRAFT_156963 [Dictyostelium purpureum]
MSSFDLESNTSESGTIGRNASIRLSANMMMSSDASGLGSSSGDILMDLDKEFEMLLDKLAIEDPEKRRQMSMLPDSSKKTLIEQHKADIYRTIRHKGPIESFSDVKAVIGSINTKSISIEVIKTLRIHLNTADRDWIQSFLDLDGVQPILNILKKIERGKSKKRKELSILQWECLRCIAALMKIKIGMEYVASFPQATNLMVLGLDTPLIKARTLILELLAAIAVTNRGHGAVLTSMIYYKEVKKEERRYHDLVQTLKSENNLEYLITCMSFINCIISSPSDLTSRIEIRKAFLNLKILKYIENLRTEYNDEKNLLTQLDVFEEELSTDEQLNSTQGNQLSMEDIFSQISSRVTGTPSQQELINLMGHFQRMSSSSLGLRVWNLYNNLASQLEEELRAHPELDINSLSLAFPEVKKSGGLFGFAKSKSPSSSPHLSSHSKNVNLKKEIEEKQKTIEHLLKQLNSFTGGQNIEKWIAEREEKNKLIAQLMAQIKSGIGGGTGTGTGTGNGTGNSEIEETLRKEIQLLRIEIETLKNNPSLFLGSPNSNGEFYLSSPNSGLSPSSNLSPSPSGEPPVVGELSSMNTDNSGISINVPDFGIPPPPPPPGVPGAPPPPPPPGVPGAPPPPPPPGMKSNKPAKPIIKPSVKMRNFNWVTIPGVKVQGTFWDKLDETAFIQALDKNELESLFSAKAPVKTETKVLTKKVVITVIDGKKANNCAIMLQHFKLSNTELKKMQINMDEKVLPLESANYLLQFVPSKEDIEAIKEYGGDPSSLGPAEQYMLTVMDIPKLEIRLRSHIFRLKYQSLVEDLVPDIKAIKNASLELKNSKKFHEILKFILAIGNYVNGSTTRGGAFGFKIETLTKMRDAKSNDNKLSLLHFLSKTIQDRSPELWSALSELVHLEHASESSLNNIVTDSSEIKRSLDLIEREYVPFVNDPLFANDKAFLNKIVEFQKSVKPQYQKIEKDIDEMNKAYEEVVTYFGEPKATPPDQFFTIISDFLEDLEKAHREYQAMLRKAELESLKMEDPEKGGLEDLSSQIRSGQLFKERRKSITQSVLQQMNAEGLKKQLKPTITNKPQPQPQQNKIEPPSQSLLKPTKSNK